MTTSPSTPARPLIGDVVAGRYRIEGVAGEGGMGIVYEAEHVILRQRVALKILLPGALSSAEALERFSAEAAAIARISCDHVVRVMDAGSLPNGAPYLVMEYLEGQNLEELLVQRGRLGTSEAVDYALQTLEALAHAHAAHVIHRDLKSANLFLAKQKSGPRIIKLLDFGVAMTADGHDDDDRIVGSPAYMSPEQLGKRVVDARTDIWSLGVVLFELLSGRAPFDGSLGEIINAVLNQDAPSLDMVPPGLSAVIARCLARDPAARWPSAAALARALAPFATTASTDTVARIERALANPAKRGERRRFETFENALQALDTQKNENENEIETEPPSSGATSATMPAPRGDALRIAVSDDLKTEARSLSGAGFDVRMTSDLVTLIEKWQPHLVVLATPSICRDLKARFKATLPIVLVGDDASGADVSIQESAPAGDLVELVRNICAMTYSPEHLP